MHFQALGLALTASLVLVAAVSPPASDLLQLVGRSDEHGHHHSAVAPLLELNETEVGLRHQPTPPSYYTIDWEDPEQASARHPGLIITHAVFMSLAFFVWLPMGIALRSIKHSLHGVTVFAFYASFFLACAASSIYGKLTPDMYPNASHARHGYSVFVIALALTLIDTLGALHRIGTFARNAKYYTVKGFAKALLSREDPDSKGSGAEYIGLASEEPVSFNHGNAEQYVPSHSSPLPRASLPRRIGRAAFAITERVLVLAGFGLFLTGIIVYTGGCRQNFLNVCLAHLIKGGIFWCYGLISFARFLGFGADLGWAWNRTPTFGHLTGEFVESFIIFLYGITNTWMERFDANPGDPYTTKQIQHIGIALMFWFAGLLGMAIESRRIRRWLAALAMDTSETVTEPATYTSSFNPFPALVIGVTGAVMAAHFQTYLFQVQIHALWGNLLLAFAVLRCLTYFFLWVAPPRSTLPSRPPTEAVGSFFLACGGVSFMFSTEEVTIAAMRRGRDDIMMFAVSAVAITCLAFCWTLCVVAFNGWVKTRTKPAVSYQGAA
ncbi:hypothetical protein C8R46DRAFT_889052 [Mycena filopes]|nr:hypothetical protein C8R46DRAFT_889052 [Mycena filopes]